MITIDKVTKTYPNGSEALKEVSLNIEKGEFVFIIGSSGSGKSTLIKLLMKELSPNSGQIIINKINTTKMKDNQVPYLRRNLGIVF
ncbi:MAG: ATP-binding cassette domain-containing protein, partial [Anaerotignaceae bacterium]